jgi:membrane protease YdiL (CAAX protease family)
MVETLYRIAGVLSSLSGLAQSDTTQPASAPASQPAQTMADVPLPNWTIALLSVGVIVTGIWLARRIKHHEKLTLVGTPGRPNRLNPAHVLLVYFLTHAPGFVLACYLLYAVEESARELTASQTISIGLLGQALSITASLLVARWCFTGRIRRGLGLCGRHWVYDTLRGAIGTLAILPWCMGLLKGATWILKQIDPALIKQHLMLEMLRETPAPWQAAIIISAVLLAPLAEELLFRGLLQSMLRRIAGPWGAILATSAIFAFLHSGQGAQAIPALLLLSVVLGYNYERSGRLVAPIVIHMLFNLVMILIALCATFFSGAT